jgi:DNA-binding transcriptional MerR regulator
LSVATEVIVEASHRRIGEAAQAAGVTTRTLRYWEQLGLVSPSGHRPGGQRLYSAIDLDRVTRIRDLQCLLGLSLAEIRAVLDTDDVLDRLRSAYREGARTDRRRHLLDEAIAANDRLIDRLDDTVGRIEAFRRQRLAKGERLRARAAELAAGGAPLASAETKPDH